MNVNVFTAMCEKVFVFFDSAIFVRSRRLAKSLSTIGMNLITTDQPQYAWQTILCVFGAIHRLASKSSSYFGCQIKFSPPPPTSFNISLWIFVSGLTVLCFRNNLKKYLIYLI